MKEEQYDIIIIGAGLGGLTAGATLAKEGKRVLVLEQHFAVGGCATTYRRKGVTFEVGLHEMDWGLPSRDMKHYIFEKLGIKDRLPLVPLPQLWGVKTEQEEIVIPEGIEALKAVVDKEFPKESEGLRRYLRAMRGSSKLAGRMPADMNFFSFFIFPITHLPFVLRDMWRKRESVGERMDKYMQSSKLKNLLNINAAYYTNNPYRLSWSYYSCAQYSYFNSAMFIKGGSQVLSNTLASVITEHGGEVRTRCDVGEILLEKNRAVGVIYYDQRSKSSVTVKGKKVMANIDPVNIFGKMLPEQYREPGIKGLKPATSLYTVYVVFKEAVSKHYKTNYSNFIVSEADLNCESKALWDDISKRDVEERPFVFVDYSTIDSGLVDEGDDRGFGVLTSISELSEWEVLDDDAYGVKKETLAKRLFERLEVHYPGIRELVEYYEVSTPKTIKRYIRSSNGTAYGYENRDYMMSGRLPKRSKTVKNLYYTGAWTNPGGGFTGAIVSGYQAALETKMPMRWMIVLKTLLCAVFGFVTVELIIYIIKLLF